MTRTVLKSRLPNVDVPLHDLPTHFFSRMRQRTELASSDYSSPRPLFVDSDMPSLALTLDELETLSTQLASGLYHSVGVRQGDRVAIVLPNTIYYLAVTMAVLMLGASCTLVNPAYTAGELAHQLSDSNARFVITTRVGIPVITDAIERLAKPSVHGLDQTLSNILCIDRAADSPMIGDGDKQLVRSIFDVLSQQQFPRALLSDINHLRTTPAFICYSSGTTGLPKGVVLSHYNIVANIEQIGYAIRTMTPPKQYERTTLAVLPIFHCFGLILAHSLPIQGSRLVVMKTFDLVRFFELVEAHRVTDTMLVPPILNAMVKLSDTAATYDLSSLQWIISGAAPLGPDTARSLEQTYSGVRVMQGYGLTETSPGLSLNMPKVSRVGSSGQLLPNIQVKVIDDSGRALGEGKVGELCFRGPNIMLEYLNNKEATNHIIDRDGFLHTGDVGFVDSRRFVFVTDRKKELIKFNGFQVAPAELEGILLQHPQVRDCAVTGVFDPLRQTEVPRAYLVLSDASTAVHADEAAKTIVKWMNRQVAYYKQLRGGYVLVSAIPKSASGKILRRALNSPPTAYDDAGVAPVHVALVADPQIVDHYSYDQTGALLRVVEFYTDIYLRKSYNVLQTIRQPEAIIFLGDLFDGGREWEDDQWLEEHARYKSIFRNRSPHTVPVYDMAGNHDIGIGNTVVEHALDRYHKYIGPTNQVLNIGGHQIILLDSLTLESDTPAMSAASRQLVERLANETAGKPRLLFSHVPLWRPDGTDCGPLRQAPGGSLLNRRGYQFRDQLFQNTTSYLLDSIKPTAIFSGDDHDTCTISHPVPAEGRVIKRAIEYTIGAFGWASGVPIASYGLLTLYPGRKLPAAHIVQNCFLPYQLGIYKVYGASFVLSLVIVIVYCYRGSRSWHPVCKPSEDDLASEIGYARLRLSPSMSPSPTPGAGIEELPLPASMPGRWQINQTRLIVRVVLAMQSIAVVALPTYGACLLYFYII
ncbi:hypothetical protein GGI09_004004 [Coemansia sp. S100]|nr:hypothetical protein GGI09_004004 [Coemansia sp. S100]